MAILVEHCSTASALVVLLVLTLECSVVDAFAGNLAVLHAASTDEHIGALNSEKTDARAYVVTADMPAPNPIQLEAVPQGATPTELDAVPAAKRPHVPSAIAKKGCGCSGSAEDCAKPCTTTASPSTTAATEAAAAEIHHNANITIVVPRASVPPRPAPPPNYIYADIVPTVTYLPTAGLEVNCPPCVEEYMYYACCQQQLQMQQTQQMQYELVLQEQQRLMQKAEGLKQREAVVSSFTQQAEQAVYDAAREHISTEIVEAEAANSESKLLAEEQAARIAMGDALAVTMEGSATTDPCNEYGTSSEVVTSLAAQSVVAPMYETMFTSKVAELRGEEAGQHILDTDPKLAKEIAGIIETESAPLAPPMGSMGSASLDGLQYLSTDELAKASVAMDPW